MFKYKTVINESTWVIDESKYVCLAFVSGIMTQGQAQFHAAV